jgi:hypothetical protein
MAEEGSGEGTGKSSIEALESLDAIIAKTKEKLALDQDDAALMENRSESLRLQSKIISENLKLQASTIEKMEKGADISHLLNESQNAYIEKLGEGVDKHKEALKLIAKQRAQQELIRDTAKEADDFFGSIGGKLGIAQNFSKTTLGNMTAMAQNLIQSGQAADILSESFFTTFNLLNISASLLEKMFESTIAVALAADSAASNFQRATGFSGEIQEDLTKIAQAGVLSGVSLEDAGKAMGSLAANFSAFNPTANETNIELASTVTLLEKTGVSADQSAKTMDFFNKVMGESPKAAADLTKQLALAGTTIGVTTSKMLSDFEAVSGYLVGFGDRTTDVFLGLQAQAKATGIAVGSLVGIAQQFDAFDTAAVAVGSLNAALGTNLSTIEMLNMSSEQRISMLAQEIDFASGGFDNLDRYTQMYVAQTIGAKDVAEAQRLINLQRNPAELAKYNAKMQEQEARQQNLNELTEKFVPVMEQFKIAVLGLGLALEPVIEALTFTFSIFGELLNVTIGLLNEVPMLAEAFGILFAVLAGRAIVMKLVAAYRAMAAASGLLTPLLLTQAGAQEVQSDIQMKAGIQNQFSSKLIDKSSKTMTAGMMKLAPALGIAAAALLAISASFYIMSQALKAAVPPLKELFIMFRDNLDVIPEMSGVLLIFGSSFVLSGAMILAGAQLMAAAIIPLSLVGLALGLMITPIERLGAGFAAMGTGIEMAASNIAPLVAGLAQILELTDDDGFFAITTDGNTTSMVSAKGGTLTNFSSENITVDVKIPEIKIPTPEVNVYIGQEKLNDLITRVVNKRLDGL